MISKVQNVNNTDLRSNFLNRVQNSLISYVEQKSEHLMLESSLYQLNNPGKKMRSLMIFELSKSLLDSKYTDYEDKLVKWAAANELIHEATLIHDDIQDQDSVRRNKPALWKKYGLAQSLNTGDFLLLLSLLPIQEIKDPRLVSLHTEMSFKLAQGQSEEIEQKNKELNIKNGFYKNCIAKKTGALFSSLAVGVGVLLNMSEMELLELSSVFLTLGCIFQMQDDVIDLFGKKGRQSFGCDIKEGKISFLIHTHLLHCPEDNSYLNTLLKKDCTQIKESEIDDLKSIFIQKQTLKRALKAINSEIEGLTSYCKKTTSFRSRSESVDKFIKLLTQPLEHITEL